MTLNLRRGRGGCLPLNVVPSTIDHLNHTGTVTCYGSFFEIGQGLSWESTILAKSTIRRIEIEDESTPGGGRRGGRLIFISIPPRHFDEKPLRQKLCTQKALSPLGPSDSGIAGKRIDLNVRIWPAK